VPNFLKVIDIYTRFFEKIQKAPGLNIDDELNQLRAELQRAFDEDAAS
jgi:hypothetical protein